MRSAYSYDRLCVTEPARGSLRRRAEEASHWAAKNGYEIVDAPVGASPSELGVKGTQSRLRGFLALIEAGKIEPDSILIIEPLGHNEVREALPNLLSIIKAGVGVATLADERIYARDSIQRDYLHLLASLIAVARAHERSRVMGQRVSAALAHKRASKGSC